MIFFHALSLFPESAGEPQYPSNDRKIAVFGER